MPASTLRAWLLGITWAVLVPALDQVFFFRYPTVSISLVRLGGFSAFALVLNHTPFEQIIPLLITFPIGKAWARFVPYVTLFGVELNPGPFTVKEHVIITMMASIGSGPAYAVSIKFAKAANLAISQAHSTFRPMSLPSKRSSTTRAPTFYVSCGDPLLSWDELNLFT